MTRGACEPLPRAWQPGSRVKPHLAGGENWEALPLSERLRLGAAWQAARRVSEAAGTGATAVCAGTLDWLDGSVVVGSVSKALLPVLEFGCGPSGSCRREELRGGGGGLQPRPERRGGWPAWGAPSWEIAVTGIPPHPPACDARGPAAHTWALQDAMWPRWQPQAPPVKSWMT